GLAALEWWSTLSQGIGIGATGVFSGIAALALMFVVSLALGRGHDEGHSQWAQYMSATLLGITELIVGVGIAGALATLVIGLLPYEVDVRLFDNDRMTDVFLFSIIGVGVLVSARSWRRYAQQKGRTMQAQITAAETRTALEEQKSRALQARVEAAEARAALEEERLRTQVERAQDRAALLEKEKDLANAQLALLRKQIEPHFIFNTLGSVQRLVEKDPQAAARMVEHLTLYLRTTLYETKGHLSSLRSEFESARAYLEIMKQRMGERLSVSLDLPDALATLTFEPLLVHTLVENAIKHGVEPKIGPVSISLSARIDEGEPRRLIVEAKDTGVGLQSNAATSGTRLGLDNVRKRIKARYGDDARLSIEAAPEGGVVSRIALPLASMRTS
ncbi:MAG TPA: histidine kinase, partial [Paraburkholderia sp.]|nr:histidine kinase [Paraburkholderia sp.]